MIPRAFQLRAPRAVGLVVAAAIACTALLAPRAAAQSALESIEWLGAEWYANRVQDWTRDGGAIVCRDSRLPIRTAHLLTRRIAPRQDGFAEIALAIGLVGSRADWSSDARPKDRSFAGVLIGAGSDEVDYRLSALVQQVPAPDGGILVVVSDRGEPLVIDFSTDAKGGFSWTLPTKTTLADLAVLARGGSEMPPACTGPFDLSVQVVPGTDGGFDVEATVRCGDEVRTAVARGVDRTRIEGAIALVSHRAERKRGDGWRFDALRFGQHSASDSWFTDHPDRAWGPVLACTYTLDRGDDGAHALALVAHFPPGFGGHTASLSLARPEGGDETVLGIAESNIDPESFTAHFRVPQVDAFLGGRYFVSLQGNAAAPFTGRLRPPPAHLTLAALSCVKHIVAMTAWNRQGVWFPHEDLTDHVLRHDPDMLFFAGDQLYEGDISGVDQQELLLDYHTKFQRWLWSFGELCRDRPAVIIPDDHDVFHGNLWGAGGIAAQARDGLSAQDAGGYKLTGRIVNAIHRTQVGNLPSRAPEVDDPIGQGIEPYSCRLRFGPADFLVLADRMWKDSASVMVPDGRCVNGFFKAEGFDPRAADRSDARLLGDAQERLLARWSSERDGAGPRKILLSQSPFAAVHTLPAGRDDSVVPSLEIYGPDGYPEDDEPSADTDTNGWPQSARARAVALLARAHALHLAGDQHLGSLIQYGVDGFRDGPFAFTPPAIANTWPRRWMPRARPGNGLEGGQRWLGDFTDAFGNPITVWAVTNPRSRGIEPRRLIDLSPGYGIIRVDREGACRLEAWPRWADPLRDAPFEGWPHRLDPLE
ncbi:MAG: hypothetical protein RL136_498 [Planctomycetota bacterium]